VRSGVQEIGRQFFVRCPLTFELITRVEQTQLSDARHSNNVIKMTTTPSPDQPSTPLSLSEGLEDSEQVTKKSRKRKAPEKKPVPHKSTLRGLWGFKAVDEPKEAEVALNTGEGKEEQVNGLTVAMPMVFKVTPEKLAAVVENRSNRETTPLQTSTEVIPETPVKEENQKTRTPKSSRRSEKKRTLDQTSTDTVRRSPRNRRQDEPTPSVAPPKKEAKPHPFFLGKEASTMSLNSLLIPGRTLQATAQPMPSPSPTEDSDPLIKPAQKRQKSSDPSDREVPTSDPNFSHLSVKSNIIQPRKSLHPFFMSRTASMESTVSTGASSIALLPLPASGKTVYLGNGKDAPFPPRGMNHIHGNSPIQPVSETRPNSLKQRKGKSKQHHYQADFQAHNSLINLSSSIDFIPPEKLVLPISQLDEHMLAILNDFPHPALKRVYHIFKTQERETSSLWTYHFRPHSAVEVLCSENEAVDLQTWMLGNRKIVSVPHEMDDFIVTSDEEDEMFDVSDGPSDDDTPRKKRRKKVFTAYSNVVILVGGHGVGKSAAVEGIAEELGYEVFEISPGSKRGGKEVMEAVGEVGQSELVTKHHDVKGINWNGLKSNGVKVGKGIEEAVKRDGRKGLICFEEVDVLYEEDKGFWTCVTGLVERSKSPIILTCNGILLLQECLLILDDSVVPASFTNCKRIEFKPAPSNVVREYLRIITLAQGHIIDPKILENIYIESKSDLRRTIMKVQFWCQFGVGDPRCGADWINWDGKKSDVVISNRTIQNGVEWRQETAFGNDVVLETMEDNLPELDLEEILVPKRIQHQLSSEELPSMGRHRTELGGVSAIQEFLETLSFLDFTVDQQFTAYEVMTYFPPEASEFSTGYILRSHPGQRFEVPEGVEIRLSPYIKALSRKLLEEKLRTMAYCISPLNTDEIVRQSLRDRVNPKRYLKRVILLTFRYLSRDQIYKPLDELLYYSVGEDRYSATVRTLDSFQNIVLDVAPQIRNIIRLENAKRRKKSEQLQLENLWTNKRLTRKRVQDEMEGTKQWFNKRLDVKSILETWLEIPKGEDDQHSGKDE